MTKHQKKKAVRIAERKQRCRGDRRMRSYLVKDIVRFGRMLQDILRARRDQEFFITTCGIDAYQTVLADKVLEAMINQAIGDFVVTTKVHKRMISSYEEGCDADFLVLNTDKAAKRLVNTISGKLGLAERVFGTTPSLIDYMTIEHRAWYLDARNRYGIGYFFCKQQEEPQEMEL